jgi:hypothetical protein
MILRRSFTKKSEAEDEKFPRTTKISSIIIDAGFCGRNITKKVCHLNQLASPTPQWNTIYHSSTEKVRNDIPSLVGDP